MIVYCLDASAWVKRYYVEAGSQAVENLFQAAPYLATATLGYVEVRAALSRKCRSNEISATEFAFGKEQLQADWSDFIGIDLDQDIMDKAANLADSYGLRGADAIHLASAVSLRGHQAGAEGKIVFVASDRELISAAKGEGFEVLVPEDESPVPQSTGSE